MNRLALPLIVTIASAASMALEIVAGRMIAPYVGMSLYTWTAVIAVVLAGLAVGHWLGGVLADRGAARAWLLRVLIAGAVTAFASQFLLRWLSAPGLEAFAPVMAVLVLTGVAFFLPSLFAGAVSPLATFLALEAAGPDAQGRVLGRMFALGAAGAIGGVLLGGLVLIPWLGSALSVAVIAAAYLLAAALMVAGAMRAALLVLSALVGFSGVAFGASWSVCERESAYFCIRTDTLAPGVRVLALDHLAHGINDRDDPLRLHSPYIALIDEVARRRFGEAGPRAAFFIGGGAYTLPRAWATRWPDSALTVAEIDPAVTAVAGDALWVDAAQFTVRHADARSALRGEAGPFDVVVGDAFADVSIPPHLVTAEFYEEIAARLSPDGLYAMNVVDLLRHPRFVTSLAMTLRQEFDSVELWLDESEVSADEKRVTWIVLAAAQGSAVGVIEADDIGGRRWVRVDLDGMLRVVAASERMVLTDDHAPVARLLGPLLLEQRFAE